MLLKKTLQLHILLVVAAAIIPYLNIFPNKFAYDDFDFFVKWDGVKSLANIPTFFFGNLPTYHQHVYRPIRSVLQALVYALSNGNEMGFHVFSLLTQISAALIVYLFIKELLNEKTALLAAIIFSLLPVHTDAITFMTASFDTAGVIFGLASLYLYILYTKRKSIRFYYLSVTLAIISFFTYEVLLILPLLILLTDICILGYPYRRIQQRIKIYAPYIAGVILFFIIRMNVVGKTFTGTLLEPLTVAQRFFTMLKAFFLYISLVIFGAPLSITHKVEISNSLDQRALLAFLGLLGILAAGIYFFRRGKKIYAFVIFWFFLSLLPVSNIVQTAVFVKESYVFLASLSWALFLAIEFEKFLNKKNSVKIIAGFAFLAIILSYGTFTLKRNMDWKNSKTLFQSALALDPNYGGGYNGLAFYYRLEKNYDLAEEYAKKAVELNPKDFLSYALLGEIAMEKNANTFALAYFQKTLELNKSYVSAYLNSGVVQMRLKNFISAEDYFLKALAISPGYTLAQKNLGILYLTQKKFDKAIPHFKKILETDDDPEVHYGLGVSLVNSGNISEGKTHLEKALELRPDYSAAKDALESLD